MGEFPTTAVTLADWRTSLTETFAPAFPWWMVVLITAGLVALVLMSYPQRVRHLPRGLRRTLIGLRLLTVAMLLFAMLRPSLPLSLPIDTRQILYVLVDSSRSMTVPDGPGGKTRYEAAVEAAGEFDELVEDWDGRLEIRMYNFDGKLGSQGELAEVPEGDLSLFAPTLESVFDTTTKSENYLGAVILSDGRENDPAGTNTLTAIGTGSGEKKIKTASDWANQLKNDRKFSIYAAPIGGRTKSDSNRDLAIESIDVQPLVYENKAVTVSVTASAIGAGPIGTERQKLTARLLVEDRSGLPPPSVGEMIVPEPTKNSSPIAIEAIRSEEETIDLELSFVPTRPGSYKLAVELEPLDGEVQQTNNRVETLITVIPGGITVAYFDTIRAEQKYLRAVNGFDQIQLDYEPVRYGGILKTRIDPEMFEPDRYQVYIIGDVPASVFGATLLSRLAERLDEGASLLMIGGPHTFGRGGYGRTAIDRFIPVRLRGGEPMLDGPLKMTPTDRGLTTALMRLDTPDENEARWDGLPPLGGANSLTAKHSDVDVLAESKANSRSLLFADTVGKARTMAFAGDTTYQWYLAGQQAEHQRFWQNVILWLAGVEDDETEGVWARIAGTNFAQGQPVPVKFGSRDVEGEPVTGKTYSIAVYRSGEETPIRTETVGGPDAENVWAWTDPPGPGDYFIRVTQSLDGAAVGPSAWARVIIDGGDPEMRETGANAEFLASLTDAGGRTLQLSDLRDEFDTIMRSATRSERTRRKPLWDNWIFLTLFVGTIGTEWFLRKRRGLV